MKCLFLKRLLKVCIRTLVVSRIFGILGIKDVESSTSKYKYRVVLQGSNVKDAGHNNVYFADTSSAPTNMTWVRSV